MYPGGFLLYLELSGRQRSRPRFMKKPKGIEELLGYDFPRLQHPGFLIAPASIAPCSSPEAWAQSLLHGWHSNP